MSRSAQSARPTFRLRFVRTALLCFVLYCLACIGVGILQRRFIYYPEYIQPVILDREAASQGIERWKNAEGQNIGWKKLSLSLPAQGQVLITHGNAGCAVERGDYISMIQQSAAMNVFILEYPGYGDRAGSPSQQSFFMAATDAFRLLNTNSPVYLVGESIGTGVAAYLAGKYPDRVAGVVLLGPYNCLTDVAQAHMPIFPVALLLRDRFPSEDNLHHYHGPVAMLVAGQDQVIPEKFGRRLYDSYAGPKRLWEFPNGNHGTVMEQPPEIWREIIDFWQTNRPALNSNTNAP